MAEEKIRWVWMYDGDGRRVTDPEPVAFTHCPNCGLDHPKLRVDLGPIAGVDAAIADGDCHCSQQPAPHTHEITGASVDAR